MNFLHDNFIMICAFLFHVHKTILCYFGIPVFLVWAFMTRAVPIERRVHYVVYLRFH